MASVSAEVFSFPEGHLTVWASASGTTSGSGVGFVRNARVTLAVGWRDLLNADRSVTYEETGRLATLAAESLYADRGLYALFNAGAAVNAKFQGVVTGGAALGKSAVYQFYSGVMDALTLQDQDGDLWRMALAMHARTWSGFGQ